MSERRAYDSESMVKSLSPGCALCFTAVLSWTGTMQAESTLALSSGGAAPGGSVVLYLTLASDPDNQPAGLQRTLSYQASDLSVLGTSAGPALDSAGKTI